MAGEMHEIAPTREGVNSNAVVDRWLFRVGSEHGGNMMRALSAFCTVR
ncbi:hypothetical protein MJ579_09345 [Klebsiella pneumoniae]|nr:hypothetical protein MJ579_09345 [Klebsiella pneumoniae]